MTNAKEVIIPHNPSGLLLSIPIPSRGKHQFCSNALNIPISFNNFNPFDSISFLEKAIEQFILGTEDSNAPLAFSRPRNDRNEKKSCTIIARNISGTGCNFVCSQVPIVFCGEKLIRNNGARIDPFGDGVTDNDASFACRHSC